MRPFSLKTAALILLPTFVFATSMFLVPLRDLAISSDKIVEAKVTSIVTKWNSDSTQIVTYIRMNITDDLIGADEDNEIIVMQPGGKVGNVTMAMEGTTIYKLGDNNIVFLRRDPMNASAWQTLGLYQGKYRIFTDASRVQRVAQDVSGKVILYKTMSGDTTAATNETGNNLSVIEFKDKVINYRTGR
ncbi:MAG: hypothetical protein JNL74_20300 [Fibrobacteres bacterium]|nr:hypothetical protein [Fibrobacterota bacterium]